MKSDDSQTTVKWLAVIDNLGGYALDAYPDELNRYRRHLGPQLVGEFATAKDAMERVRQCLTKMPSTADIYEGTRD